MGIPLKKSRRVEFRGRPYRYIIREAGKTEYPEEYLDDPSMSYKRPHGEHVLITVQEEAESPGRVLQAKFTYGVEITRGIVEKVVEKGLRDGWEPSARGAAFDIGVQDGLIPTSV